MSSNQGKVPLDRLDKLAIHLIELQRQYESTSDRDQRRQFRQRVIEAKQKARWASIRSKDEARRALKSEMLTWLLTWLENPLVFEVWVNARQRQLELLAGGDRDLDA